VGAAEVGAVIGFLAELGQWFAENWDGDAGYLYRTWEHIQVSAISLVTAAAIAVPLGAWLGHTGRGGLIAVSAVNIGRALPSFGIIALALPITIRLADKIPFVDSGLGFFPTFIALFALALPPIFTNTYAGIRSVDPEIVEAARGMGVRGPRILWEIEMPMASPVMLAGIRTSAVQVVATATLGALVAYGGLGRYIIDGFAVQDDVRIVAGALLVALLSVLTEVGFAALQRRVVPRPLQLERTRQARSAGADSAAAAPPPAV
jgi:osmoprotectant transport system permease protein